MPHLIKGKVCAITYQDRFEQEPAQTIIGTYTGEIDSWGKRTIALLDAEAEGPYYLFPDEVLAVEPCSEAEIQAEVETICEGRLLHALRLLREADRLLISVEGQSRYRRASQVARASLIVQKGITVTAELATP